MCVCVPTRCSTYTSLIYFVYIWPPLPLTGLSLNLGLSHHLYLVLPHTSLPSFLICYMYIFFFFLLPKISLFFRPTSFYYPQTHCYNFFYVPPPRTNNSFLSLFFIYLFYLYVHISGLCRPWKWIFWMLF